MTSVIDLLRARLARASGPPYNDGASIALAVEGGGMRGVISAGMVSALEDLGLAGTFDAIYGSSAGAINATYMLAGQANLGTTIYYEDINNWRFISFARALGGRPIVSLSYLLDDVARRRKHLDVEKVLAVADRLHVIATDIDEHLAVAFSGFANGEELFSALRASATMPVVAGDPHIHQGRRCLDASLSEPIPVVTAERAGHTHIVALLTRGAGQRPHPSAFDRRFVGPRLRRISPELERQYLARSTPYAELSRLIDAGTGPLKRTSVLAIRVSDCPISKLERRQSILEAGARRGYDAVMRAFPPEEIRQGGPKPL